MQQLVTLLHILVAIALIALILMQKGRGSSVGAAFGSGASNTMFGSQGATPFLVKVIAGLALLFFLTSLTLGYLNGKAAKTAANNPLIPISTQMPK
jgi:preprotein translocase subunit SecG